jgi:hypothetical protein
MGWSRLRSPECSCARFFDLAVVLAPMALVGALVFARVLEREL